MLSDEKILITGVTGQVAKPLAEYLAPANEVWGLARFGAPGSRELVESAGVTTRVVDLAVGDFSEIPTDFTYVVHLAASIVPGYDYDEAINVNAESTGLLAAHCRQAKAMLVTSTFGVYDSNPDPEHRYKETDPLGDARAPFAPTYSVSKIAEEAVARATARIFDLPVTVARINVSYGPNGGLPAHHLDWMMAGQQIPMRQPGPNRYNPIHQDDMNRQVEGLLAAASVPATIVNWGGDEVVSAEDWCSYLAEVSGMTPSYVQSDFPGSHLGTSSDNTKRLALIGPCTVDWREGMRAMFEARHGGGRAKTDDTGMTSERLLSQFSAGTGEG